MKINYKVNKTINKFLLSLMLLFFVVIFFAGMVFAIVHQKIKKEQEGFQDYKNKYNIVLSTRYGFTDKGFSQQAVEGVCDAFFNIEEEKCDGSHNLFKKGIISYGFPGTMDNFVLIREYLDNFIDTEKINNFVFPGFTFTPFLQKWAIENPQYYQNINFISIGTLVKSSIWPKNVWQLNFEEYLPGYYAGLYAGNYALMHPNDFKDGDNKKNGKQIHFAILGGLWIPPITNYALGFKLGLEKAELNKKRNDVELILTSYDTIGGFDSDQYSDKVKFKSNRLFQSGVSAIFSIAVSLTGAIHAAALEQDANAGTSQHWVIGVDVDQGVNILNESPTNTEYKGKILTSAVLKIKEKLTDLIANTLQKEDRVGENIRIVSQKYLSIPERFKKTAVWKEIKKLGLDEVPSEIVKLRTWSKDIKDWLQNSQKLKKFLNNFKLTTANFQI